MTRTLLTIITLFFALYTEASVTVIAEKNDSMVTNMEDTTFALLDIVVKGQRPKTKLTGNSMITRIQGSILEKSGSAKEMLAKVPGMIQKGDDLEVLGKGTPIYYINGRKIQDIDELKSLRSEEIKDVEVITNPGAQYDATVSAVVRIRTLRREGTGFGYDAEIISNNDLIHGYYDPNANVNLRYRTEDLDLFGSINCWKWDSVNESSPEQNSFIGQNGELLNIFQKSSFRTNWRSKGINSTLGFNYQIANNHYIGARIERHDKWFRHEMFMNTEIEKWIISDGQKEKESNYNSQYEKSNQPFNWNGNAYYNGKFDKLGVDLNIDFLTSKDSYSSDIEDYSDQGDTKMSHQQNTSNKMLASKLVLSYPVWKGLLNVGSEMTFVKRGDKYGYQGLEIPNSSYNINEDNIAAFAEYACNIPTVGNISAGLRFEHVGFDYKDLIDNTCSMKRYTDDWFPSLSWANQWGSWQAALSYSIKTNRPSYWSLSDAITYINSYTLQQGDSKLKNTIAQVFGANLRWKFITLLMNYSRTDDAISQWSYIYNDNGVILIKNINLDVPVHKLSAFINAAPTFGCYSPNWTVGFQKYNTTMTLADPREATGYREVKYNKPIFITELNNALRFKHSWQLEGNMTVVGKGDYMNFRILNTTCNLSFVVQKCWLKNDALCLRASMNDVLQTNNQNIEMDCGYNIINQKSFYNQHRLKISLRYTFNAQKSKYKGTGAGHDAAERMSK